MKITVFPLILTVSFAAGCAEVPALTPAQQAALPPAQQVAVTQAKAEVAQYTQAVDRRDFTYAASLFSAKGELTDHAGYSATGPAAIAKMLAEVGSKETFPDLDDLRMDVRLAGPAVSISGWMASIWSSRRPPNAPQYYHAVVRLDPAGVWRISYLEMYQEASVNHDGIPGDPTPAIGTDGTFH